MGENDIEIVCVNCRNTFVFSVGEQKFYEEHKFPNPKRCKTCRQIKKNTAETTKVETESKTE